MHRIELARAWMMGVVFAALGVFLLGCWLVNAVFHFTA
jgi:hypothetical protein